MTPRPLILDVFCGAGGAAVGYQRAGFDVLGVDHEPQPHYPFPFLRAEALGVLADLAAGRAAGPFLPTGRRYSLHDFAAIHASPPCQRYSQVNNRQHLQGRDYPDLIGPTRAALEASGRPYVIENVQGAPLRYAARCCGSAFGLLVRRHRYFESSVVLFGTDCRHGLQRGEFPTCFRPRGRERRTSSVVQVYGHTAGKALWPEALGIGWMTSRELTQAVPPAYTHYLGAQLLRALEKGVSR